MARKLTFQITYEDEETGKIHSHLKQEYFDLEYKEVVMIQEAISNGVIGLGYKKAEGEATTKKK